MGQHSSAAVCRHCGYKPSASISGVNRCPHDKDGEHSWVTEDFHNHNLTGFKANGEINGRKVWSGKDGIYCTAHPKNDHFATCDACAYAENEGGIDHQWRKDNPGTHTCSIVLNVPTVKVPSSEEETPDISAPNEVSAWDNQVGGQHYKSGIQPFTYALANNLNCLEFSVVKYLRKKGDKAKRLEDLRKAQDCLAKLIESVEKGECE